MTFTTTQPVNIINKSKFWLMILLMTTSSCFYGNAQATEQSTSGQDVRDPRNYFFSDTFGDLPEELEQAKKDRKLGLLLFFEMDGCPYCHHMLTHIFNQKSVQDWYQKRFVSFAIDIYGDVEIHDFDGITLPSKMFSAQRKIFSTPTLVFIGMDGNEMYRRVGSIRSVEVFMLLGEYISENHYLELEFRDFARKKIEQQRSKSTHPLLKDKTLDEINSKETSAVTGDKA